MHHLMMTPPHSTLEPVTDVFHGVSVTDPYRWLEDQDSSRTRAWIEAQTCYARAYLDSIPGREHIRDRIREFLAVETYDSLQKVGDRYFFRKRLPDQEQPCICMREGADGEDQLLIDPSECIDCAACEPACPWEAIYQDEAVPQEFKKFIEINASIEGQTEIEQTPHEEKPTPSPEEVSENREKWLAKYRGS